MSQKTTPALRRADDAGMSQLGAVGGGISPDPIVSCRDEDCWLGWRSQWPWKVVLMERKSDLTVDLHMYLRRKRGRRHLGGEIPAETRCKCRHGRRIWAPWLQN